MTAQTHVKPAATFTINGQTLESGYEPSCILNSGGDKVELFYSQGGFYLEATRISQNFRTTTRSFQSVRLTAGEASKLAAMLGDPTVAHIERADGHEIRMAHVDGGRRLSVHVCTFEPSAELEEWAKFAALLLSGVRKWRAAVA